MIHPLLLAIVVDHVLTSVVLFVRPLLLAVQVQLVQPVPQELQAEDDEHNLPVNFSLASVQQVILTFINICTFQP